MLVLRHRQGFILVGKARPCRAAGERGELFRPLGGKGPTAGVALATEEFERARETYYRLAGCDPATGYPTRAKLAGLGLDWLAGEIPGPR
jgi:hypothetical protein